MMRGEGWEFGHFERRWVGYMRMLRGKGLSFGNSGGGGLDIRTC